MVMTMKELIERMEDQKFSTREYLLMGVSLFLSGVVLGILLSPKGERVVGSNNGSHNLGYLAKEDGNTKNKKC